MATNLTEANAMIGTAKRIGKILTVFQNSLFSPDYLKVKEIIQSGKALSLAKALESLNVMWLEDLITGDYTPYTAVEAYRLISSNTTTPIHTGEQIYLKKLSHKV
jgi:hypothetical protein